MSSYDWAFGNRVIGIKEDVQNPYIMTLSTGDEDLFDTHTLQISSFNLESVWNGSAWVYGYGEETDITDLFNFDPDTGALSFVYLGF